LTLYIRSSSRCVTPSARSARAASTSRLLKNGL
jgi:hypothetical protein